jgi:hypothetical protein
MHIHANQFDLQLSAQYAAERAAAQKEAAGVRKKLFQLASVEDGGATGEGRVTAVGARRQPREQKSQSYPQSTRGGAREHEEETVQQAAEAYSNGRFSTWA